MEQIWILIKNKDFEDKELQYFRMWVRVETEGSDENMFKDIE